MDITLSHATPIEHTFNQEIALTGIEGLVAIISRVDDVPLVHERLQMARWIPVKQMLFVREDLAKGRVLALSIHRKLERHRGKLRLVPIELNHTKGSFGTLGTTSGYFMEEYEVILKRILSNSKLIFHRGTLLTLNKAYLQKQSTFATSMLTI